MARLHEYQGKAILAANGFKIPRGRAVSSPDEAEAAAAEIGGEVVIKIQAWTTGRAGIGGVAFAQKPDDVRDHAARMLKMKVGQFPVEAVLVEEKIAIEQEFFLSLAIDDAARAPVLIFAAGGGTGIEERAAETRRIPCNVKGGPVNSAVAEAAASCGLSSAHAAQLAESIKKLFAAARSVEARSLEINPLVLTKEGEFVAADCRITIDDYAVARHPKLKIEIAREFDHPPTELERVAYAAEQADHRGTFYFAQLATAAAAYAGRTRLEKSFAEARKALPINVDGATGAILADLGMNPAAFNGIFMIARTPGLVAHVIEEQTREKPMRHRPGEARL